MSLSFDTVSFAYRGHDVLSDVSFKCHRGVTALLGPNGAGKTTLMRLAASARRPRAGAVVVSDGTQTLRPGRGRRLRAYRRRFGWLPQGFTAPGGLTAAEVVAYAAWLKGVPSRQAVSATPTALAAVGLADRADEKVRRLSGGMVQRLGIAQAIAHRPPVLLLDEPTVGLDPDQRASFRAIVRAAAETATVLVSTHLTEDVDLMCDRVVVIDDGTVRFSGSVEAFAARAGEGDPPAGVSRSEHAYRAIVAGTT